MPVVEFKTMPAFDDDTWVWEIVPMSPSPSRVGWNVYFLMRSGQMIWLRFRVNIDFKESDDLVSWIHSMAYITNAVTHWNGTETQLYNAAKILIYITQAFQHLLIDELHPELFSNDYGSNSFEALQIYADYLSMKKSTGVENSFLGISPY